MLLAVGTLAAAALLSGCEVDSYFDPSRTGRFQHGPTTIPILERIDVIEEHVDPWGETTEVMPEDLLPSDLTYVLAPGDFITVEVFAEFAPGQWRVHSRRIDATGRFRLPEVGDLFAAGKTVQEFEDLVIEELREFMADPIVNVVVEDPRAFTYTVEGDIPGVGLYTLRNPDLRLTEALAIIGGAPRSARTIYVVRKVPLTDEVRPAYERERRPTPRDEQPRRDPVDIEELIEQLEDDPPNVNPGMLGHRDEPPVDVDDLEPVRVADRPMVDLDELRERAAERTPPPDESFIYVEERGEWVRMRADRPQPHPDIDLPERFVGEHLFMERVIEIPYERLRYDSSYNIVIRPNDRIIVQGPRLGLVYIDGEINRPGVYTLPFDGGLTLSRLVASAGGLGGLAIPERIDLTRVVGADREATIRLNLAAIRRRTEPDIYLKHNDHITIGTSWFATPLAVIRNGFRATYGFGFLLDRNFGNDVFGAPPSRVGTGG